MWDFASIVLSVPQYSGAMGKGTKRPHRGARSEVEQTASVLASAQNVESSLAEDSAIVAGVSSNEFDFWVSFVTRLVREDEGLQKLQAMAPLFKHFGMLPGDFAPCAYAGDLCCLTLSVGVKLHSNQEHMRDNPPRISQNLCHLLPPHAKKKKEYVEALVGWCVDGACMPRDPVCARNHGTASRTTGPSVFLKQLGITTTIRPFPQAEPLDFPSASTYFLALRPCDRLELLQQAIDREWPEGTPTDFANSTALLRFTQDFAVVLDECLVGVSMKYTALQLSRKVALALVSPLRELATKDLDFARLKEASADHSDQLKPFPDDMPAAILEKVFDVWAPHFSMYLCLLRPVLQSAAWIRGNIDLLRQILGDYKATHGFSPSPVVLCALAEEALALGAAAQPSRCPRIMHFWKP